MFPPHSVDNLYTSALGGVDMGGSRRKGSYVQSKERTPEGGAHADCSGKQIKRTNRHHRHQWLEGKTVGIRAEVCTEPSPRPLWYVTVVERQRPVYCSDWSDFGVGVAVQWKNDYHFEKTKHCK